MRLRPPSPPCRRTVVVLAIVGSVLGALMLVGCGSSASHTSATTRHAVLSADDTSANVVLWVSNQSYVDEKVRIVIDVDRAEVVNRKFGVEQLQDWQQFRLKVPPGKHTLDVRGGEDGHLVRQVLAPAAGPRYVVIAYWREPEASSGLFTLETLDQAPGFA
jgi:hypothetical protein